jgi:Mn2+/Fe2+ NRAMP family transporter
MRRKIKIGPGIYITSAFIGPGTVTMCLLAGVNSGVSMLWAILFSTISTIILQDMCVRLGFYTKSGLDQTVRTSNLPNIIKYIASVYIIVAIFIGNSAYQSGNLAGTKLGIQLLGIPLSGEIILTLIFIFCLFSILLGKSDYIKNILSSLVLVMCISFIFLAIIKLPSLLEILKGSFIPRIEGNNMMIVIGLIGTTVVPYNLFLHTNLIAESEDDIVSLRKDSLISIIIGGIISICIVIIGNSAFGMDIKNIQGMSQMMEQGYGVYSRYLLGMGLFAAGLSSSLTAPLAAALVTQGILNFSKNKQVTKMKAVQVVVLLVGYFIVLKNFNAINVIKIAQVINGILLPVFAIYLLTILNDRVLMKVHKNSNGQNVMGILVIIVTIILSIKSIYNFI